MRFLDLLIFAVVCLFWALNLIVSRVLFTQFGVAPIFYAAFRFALVALLLSPLLRPLPKPLFPVLGIGLLMGACHFGLMFLALDHAPSASVSIVLQMAIPVTSILSVFLLSEEIGPVRIIGSVLAVGGVILVMWNPAGQGISIGLVFAFLSATSIALGSVLLKRYGPIKPLAMQAWVALASFPPLAAYSALAEHEAIGASLAAGWPFWAGLAFSVLVVTIVAHTLYLRLLQRYPASVIAPLGLMTPLMTVAMGIVLLGEAFDLRMAVGGIVALVGLLLVLRQQAARDAEQPREAS